MKYSDTDSIRCDSGGVLNFSGDYIKVAGEVIPIGPRYNYDLIWGYLANVSGEFIRVYIPDNEDHFNLVGADYIPGSGYYRRSYTLDTRDHYRLVMSAYVLDNSAGPDSDGAGPDGDGIGDYLLGDYGKFFKDTNPHYSFNGSKFAVNAAGKFIQEYDSPVGYWTYSSKLQIDENYNTADYGWIVFHQSGGTFGVNISSYKLKIKEDLQFEKQFVRCVRGGNGDIEDVDY
jgi:hypothetical protein